MIIAFLRLVEQIIYLNYHWYYKIVIDPISQFLDVFYLNSNPGCGKIDSWAK